MSSDTWTLSRDCPTTLIPAGDPVVLPEGTEVEVSQALGGSVTVRVKGMLYRIAPDNISVLGEEAVDRYREATGGAVAQHDASGFSEDQVWEVLKGCFDPEIPVNIVDLGLIYDLKLTDIGDDQHMVNVKMTLTAQGCGMGPVIADDARARIESLGAVHAATVDIVWDPPWTPHMISPEGRQQLGLDS